MNSSTSSFRIPDDLRIRLEEMAHHMKKGKNWIINRALQEYLARNRYEALAAEARRQSLLASAVTTEEEKFWQDQSDDGGWK